MFKKIFSTVLCICALCLSLSSCGCSKPKNNNKDKKTEPTNEPIKKTVSINTEVSDDLKNDKKTIAISNQISNDFTIEIDETNDGELVSGLLFEKSTIKLIETNEDSCKVIVESPNLDAMITKASEEEYGDISYSEFSEKFLEKINKYLSSDDFETQQKTIALEVENNNGTPEIVYNIDILDAIYGGLFSKMGVAEVNNDD